MSWVPTPQYEVVKNYVRNGLSDDHWIFETGVSKKQKLGTWHDTDIGEYKDYPPDALYSARFMDGLTSRMFYENSEFYDAYVSAGCRSKNCIWWHEKFVQHAGVVFNYFVNKQFESSRTKKQKTSGNSSSSTSSSSTKGGVSTPVVDSLGNHSLYNFDHNTYSQSPIVSGHLVGEYTDAINRKNFLNFCISKIEGYQSQTFMRNKLFCILDVDAHKLPKTWNKKCKEKETQQKWLHILQSVINAFSEDSSPWLTFKFYGEDNLDWLFVELVPRVKQTLNHLNNAAKFFETKEGSEALIMLLLRMKEIEEEYDNIADYCESPSRKSLFAPIIKKYLPIADAGYRMSHNDTGELKKLTLATLAFPSEDESEDEDENEP